MFVGALVISDLTFRGLRELLDCSDGCDAAGLKIMRLVEYGVLFPLFGLVLVLWFKQPLMQYMDKRNRAGQQHPPVGRSAAASGRHHSK